MKSLRHFSKPPNYPLNSQVMEQIAPHRVTTRRKLPLMLGQSVLQKFLASAKYLT